VTAKIDRHHAGRGGDLKRIGKRLGGPAGNECHAIYRSNQLRVADHRTTGIHPSNVKGPPRSP
jgi:hypothetical protein